MNRFVPPPFQALSSDDRCAAEESEPFVHFPGNVMILEEVKIQSKMRASVSASLCGIPRIKPLGSESSSRSRIMLSDLKSSPGPQTELYAPKRALICSHGLK